MTQTISTPTPGLLPPAYAQLLAAIDDAVDYADTLAWTMTQDQVKTLVPALAIAVARVQHVELLTVGEAEARDLPAKSGATSTATWWAHQTRHTRLETHRRVHTLHRLGDQPTLAAAVRDGRVLTDQCEVIAKTVAEMPADLIDPTVSGQAEDYLVDQATHFDAKALAAQAQHLLTVIAPEIGEAHDAKLLADQEKAADEACRFTSRDDGHGKYHFRGTLPTRHGAILEAAIQQHLPPAGPTDADRPAPLMPQRRGHALCRLLEAKSKVKVVVTMTLQTLMGGLAAAALGTGEPLSAGQARRMACTAGLVPIVLGGPSQPLDVGRTRRLYTGAQHAAMAVRDGGCTVDGCHHPPSRCDAHHDTPWSQGGHTDLDDGRLLCERHHTLIHDPRYTIHPALAGKIRIIMRT